jgi:hypothetical protein
MADTLETGNKTVPADLAVSTQPDIDKDYFSVSIKNLKLSKTYAVQFQWVYDDGKTSEWSPTYVVTTSNESAPAVPSSTVPTTGSGGIPVTLTTFPTNARRVDVYVIGGTTFGTGKVAYSFSTAGTHIISAPGGTYVVELRSVSPTGVTSAVGESFTITVADIGGEVIAEPTNPNGFSASRILAGVQLNWAGTYSNGTFTGFEAIKVFAGTAATATPGTYIEVGVLTGNNVKNTITIPVDGTYVKYGQATYLHAAAVNKNATVGTIQANVASVALGPGKATDADINDGAVVISKLASDVLTVGNLKAGDINATSYIRAGTKSTDGLSGARIEISSATITQTGTNVLPGFYIYNSQGTAVLSAPLGGGLSITGSGTFTGSITGASGEFTGDLGASGGNFTVRSGIMTALAGSIGGWVINSQALKNSAVAYPNIMLDPSNSKIELRQTASNSIDTGNSIKMDTVSGLRIGVSGSPSFTVDMSGSLTATNATISKSSGSNTIILDNSGFRAIGAEGTVTIGYDGNITMNSPGNLLGQASGSTLTMTGTTDGTSVVSTSFSPGTMALFQGPVFGSSSVNYYEYLANNQLNIYATGLSDITWKNFYVNPGTFNFIGSQIWTALGGDDYRMLGVSAFGTQMLGPRLFSGTATSNSTINTDINGRSYANGSVNGDFYFSTA